MYSRLPCTYHGCLCQQWRQQKETASSHFVATVSATAEAAGAAVGKCTAATAVWIAGVFQLLLALCYMASVAAAPVEGGTTTDFGVCVPASVGF